MTTQSYIPSSPPRLGRYGLVAAVGGETAIAAFMAANPPEGTNAERWGEGFTWQPFDCTSVTAAFPLDCALRPTFTEQSFPSALDYFPFGIYTAVKCSDLGNNMDVIHERARQKLITTTSYKVETEFWKGTEAQVHHPGNQYLANGAGFAGGSGVVTPVHTASPTGPIPAPYALGLLTKKLGEALQGNRGMIHCTSECLTIWAQQHVARYENGYWFDVAGNIIVAGAGYDGTGPGQPLDQNFDTSWAYGTSMVDVRLSPIIVQDMVDQTNGIQFAVATRAAAATWDGCALLGVNVDLCQPFCTPGP